MNKKSWFRLSVLFLLASISLYFYSLSWDDRASISINEETLKNEVLNKEFLDFSCRLQSADDLAKVALVLGNEYTYKKRGLLETYEWSGPFWKAHSNFSKGRILNFGYYHEAVAPDKLIKPRLLGEIIFPLHKTDFGTVVEKWGSGYPVGVIWKTDQDDSSIVNDAEKKGNGTCQVYYGFFPKDKDRMEVLVFQDGILVNIYH